MAEVAPTGLAPPETPTMGVPSRVLHRLIRVYQWLREGRPSPCRYTPSCSSYALEAIEVHGFGRGSWLSVRRLCRCHPWGGHGWDRVPDRPVSQRPVSQRKVV